MRIATIALACGLLALAPGCGGDDEKAAETSRRTHRPDG